jgi:hypothetical protein
MRNSYKNVIETSGRIRQLGRPRHKLKGSIEKVRKENEFEIVEYIHLDQMEGTW